LRNILLGTIWLGLAGIAQPQEQGQDRLTIPFSDPSRPGTVRVNLISGGITVKGYAGKEVIVEARVENDERRNSRAEAKGLKRIPNTSTGLSAEEENNVISLSTGSVFRDVDVVLQVPSRTSLMLKTINDGDVIVERVEGEIEVNAINGDVTITQVSGSVVAHATNGDMKVTMQSAAPDKPMSFTSFNGDVDVTLPADLKANIVLKSDHGEIYSDFEIRMDPSANKPVVETTPGKKSKYRVTVEQTMRGTLNGGGPEIQFKTVTGDIYIRKLVK